MSTFHSTIWSIDAQVAQEQSSVVCNPHIHVSVTITVGERLPNTQTSVATTGCCTREMMSPDHWQSQHLPRTICFYASSYEGTTGKRLCLKRLNSQVHTQKCNTKCFAQKLYWSVGRKLLHDKGSASYCFSSYIFFTDHLAHDELLVRINVIFVLFSFSLCLPYKDSS